MLKRKFTLPIKSIKSIKPMKPIIPILLSIMLLFQSFSPVTVSAQTITITSRLSGSDRYATSLAIVQNGWTKASNVIIATGLNFPDALSASALSKAKDAPIILTPPKALSTAVIDELKKLGPANAFIVGGTGVISSTVDYQLKSLGIGVTRLAGANRYDTSRKIAEQIGVSNGIIVATGENFPDALSIAPIASIKGMPILLSPKAGLDTNTLNFLKGKNIPVSYIVGGTGVLSSSIDKSVPNSKRLSGSSRYGTNLAINTEFKSSLNFDSVYLATGISFPDALSGSALAAKNNAPIILTDKASISTDTMNFLNGKNVKHVTILGGTGAVSVAVENQINTGLVVRVTSVSLNKTSATLTIGDRDTLTAAVYPSNATNKTVKWSSSNAAVAAVDSFGKVTGVSAGTAAITVTTADGAKTAVCKVTVNSKGYVDHLGTGVDLNVRSSPSLTGTKIGQLYSYQKIIILGTVTDGSNLWDKINYNNSTAYVSDAYIQKYTSPPDTVSDVAVNITKQFEVGTGNQIAGNFDSEGLSLGYLQWCIGQGTLQILLNRMDRQYNTEMNTIFGDNYNTVHSMILDTFSNQMVWAEGINDASNNITEPWYSQFVSLSKNQHFISIEKDAEVYTVKQAMNICDKYNLKTMRGFALAFDIVNQNGSISSSAAAAISTAIQQNPGMTEKSLLSVIGKAVSGSSSDVLSRKMAIVSGTGIVHGTMLYLDKDYGLNDSNWR